MERNRYSYDPDQPFGGLFNSKTRTAIIEELVSDPYHVYSPKEIAQLLDTTYPTLRSHLNELVESGLIEKDTMDDSRPKYRMNFKSKRLIALSLLMDAINDDRDGSDTMERSIINYHNNHLKNMVVRGDIKVINVEGEDHGRLNIETEDEKIPVRITEGSV